jgi:Fe-S-cluster containining protein
MLERVLTDLVQIRELGLEKVNDNMEFHRRLASRPHGMEPLQRIADEVARQIDCLACANCCRRALPPVTRRDMARLARHFGMTAREVREKYTCPDDESPKRRVLRTRYDSGCVFLSGNLCVAYSVRPKACSDFPRIHRPAPGAPVSRLCRWTSLCPIVYNAVEQCKEATGFGR